MIPMGQVSKTPNFNQLNRKSYKHHCPQSTCILYKIWDHYNQFWNYTFLIPSDSGSSHTCIINAVNTKWSKNNCAHILEIIKPPHNTMAYMTCGIQPPPSSNSVTLFHVCKMYTKNDMVFVVFMNIDFWLTLYFPIHLIQTPSLVNMIVHLPPPNLLTCASVFSHALSQN